MLDRSAGELYGSKMGFGVGDQVKVRMPGGGVQYGTIKAISVNGNFLYGVKTEYTVLLESGKTFEFKESELIALTTPLHSHCTCGSKVVGHPGHSYWCAAYERR